MTNRRNSRSAVTLLPSPMIALAVGVLCVAYIQLSYSASIPRSGRSSSTSTTTSGTKTPSRITSLRTGKSKPHLEVQAGRMKASDIKACISKAFCEVNSASKMPNYAVNKEFFDLMNQIHALSGEDLEIDSGSTSVEYDDDDDEDDDDVSSEESSSERLRGYPPPPPPPPGYRRGRELLLANGTTIAVNGSDIGSSTPTATVSTTLKKVKDKSKSKDKKEKKSKGKKKKTSGQKMVKKFVNGTLVSVPKRRSRVETKEEKAEKQDFVNRKQREMGQVNDLAALIRISADIGLTLRSPRKCRTLFNKCTMSHEQIVDLFNQTLLAVTTPSSSSPQPSSVPTTKRAKVTTTLAAAVSSADTPTLSSSPLSTVQEALTPTVHTVPTTLSTTPSTTTTQDDVNRSSKSRHDFSDEDVEYMTDTEIQPVQTYALFVNDAPEESVKTAEEVIVQETFKKYANAFPVETALPGDLPSLRKRSSKKKSLKSSARSSGSSKISKRGQTSSEEDEDEEDEEDDEPTSTSLEETADKSSGFRIENPYPGYRVNKGGIVDDEKSVESAEPNSGAVKESTEGILPTLVQKEKPKNKQDEDEEDEEDEESEESAEDDLDLNEHDGDGLGVKGAKLKKSSKYTKSNNKKKATAQSNKPSLGMDDEDSSEEDEVADDQQAAPPPWAPVYSMYMKDKKNKQGYTKKQKGPYKGGEGPYADSPSYHTPQASSSSLTSFLKKPWGGSNSASQEIPGAPPTQSHETGAYPDYHNQHFHGGPPGGPAPFGSSQEAGALPEQKPGFFQSIMSWFTGGSKAAEQADPNGYGAGPYGAPGGQHGLYGGHGGHGSIEHDEPQKDLGGAGSPWPSQPDPAGVGHFGQTYNYRGYRHPEVSSEEEEELLDEPTIISKKERKNKRRYRGRSDSIITTPPKKSAPPKKSNSGPPPPVVVIPKDSKSVAPAGSPPVSAYEPNHQYEKLIQVDGGLTTVNNAGKKVVVVSSQKENKRAKKAAVKPKNKNQKKKSQKQRERASRESSEDDDEAFSSEELYNQQVAKMKSGTSSVTLGGNNNGNNHNSGGSYSVNKQNDQSSSTKPTTSFHSHFESMFGTEEKDKYKIKGNDDGSLLYGFDSLSSTLHAAPELPITPGKKKPSSYKVNKNKKKKKGQQQPVKFNNKEVIESSEEEEEKKKKRK